MGGGSSRDDDDDDFSHPKRPQAQYTRRGLETRKMRACLTPGTSLSATYARGVWGSEPSLVPVRTHGHWPFLEKCSILF